MDINDIATDVFSTLRPRMPAVARQLGLVNVDSINLNGTFINRPSITVTMIGTSQRAEEAKAHSHRQAAQRQDKCSTVLSLDMEARSHSHSESENASARASRKDMKEMAPTVPLPVRFGTYIRFEDARWWDHAPEFVDVMSLRIVSICRPEHCIPSIDGGDDRKIVINSEGSTMSVRRVGVESSGFHFSNVHRNGSTVARFKSSNDGNPKTWSLRPLQPNQVTDLDLNSCDAVLYYSSEFAECVWLLVQQHPYRGDEAYILIWKGELDD